MEYDKDKKDLVIGNSMMYRYNVRYTDILEDTYHNGSGAPRAIFSWEIYSVIRLLIRTL